MTSKVPPKDMQFVTRDTLDRALPDVLAAPKTDAPISLLCIRSDYNQRHYPDRISMTRAGGVAGDFEMSQPWLELADGIADPRIQVSILPKRVLDLVWLDREKQAHPGDTIIADLDMSHDNLPAGSLIRVGTAVLCVSDIWNEGCVKWKVRYGRDAYKWASNPAHEVHRLRGVLCSIEQDGEATLSDTIVKL